MPKARSDQKDIVIRVLKESFHDNPSILHILNVDRPIERQLERLLDCAYERARNRGGVYISSNEKSVALCFSPTKGSFSLRELFTEIRFGISVSFVKSLKTLKRQSKISRCRKSGPHLLFWFFGAIKDNNGSSYELMKELFEESAALNIPIIAETSVDKNRRVYERFGFNAYNIYDDGDGPRLWMMIRPPCYKMRPFN